MKLTSIAALAVVALAAVAALPASADHPATIIWGPGSESGQVSEASPILCGFAGQGADQAEVTLVASSAADCVAAGGAVK